MNAPDVDRPPIDFALYLAGVGLRIIPIPPRSKKPILKDWPTVATCDPDMIYAWFDADPDGNYGIVTAGLVVVDIDPRHGGHLWLEDHEGRLPDSWRFRTGGGGLHLVYRTPNGRVIGNRAGVAPGIDIRANGGQIVGPGSRHPDGGTYTIEAGPDDVELASAPEWLLDLIERPAADAQTGAQIDLNAGPIPEGARDDTLTRIAGHLLKALAPHKAQEELHRINEARCTPPLPHGDVDRIVKSIGDREARKTDRQHADAQRDPTEPLGDPFAKLPAPPLPRGLLPPVIEAFAEREAATKGVATHGPAMAALVVCAGAIPDKVRVRVKLHEPWHESARLWLALIGPPSAKKSPVIRAAMAPLKHLEKVEIARWQKVKNEWDAAEKESRGLEPTPRRFILNDTTIEAAGRILAENPYGLLLERDELAGWFGALDKYSGGRGAAADRAFWLTSWNGGPYACDRISRSSVHIPNLSICLLGGIQPDAIRRIAADTVDDGLLQRLIPISVGPGSLGEDIPDLARTWQAYDGLVHRLAGLPEQTIKFGPQAQEVRRGFERHTQQLSNLEVLSPQLAAFAGKLDGLFARLALVFHFCDEQYTEMIGEITAQRVVRLMHEFIIPHALRFYLDLASDSGILAEARSVAGWILAKKADRLTFGSLTNNVRACRGKTRDDVRRMLEPLEMFGWIMPDDLNQPRAWEINPLVHERFAERAEQERTRRDRIREIITNASGG